MHFQIPPKAHVKLVSCPFGEVIDVVVDLVKRSTHFWKIRNDYTLHKRKGTWSTFPKGLAHGFYVVSKKAIIVCQLTTVYSPEHDSGTSVGPLEIPCQIKNQSYRKKIKDYLNIANLLVLF
ncbi:dTDP-4-dehydrorhamnose 3,5-epimerase family protein [Anaerobacillus sp. HL2]|nr:dTDP-4-dehydrorhamnose 3,5-epimerase family protein [Anaerobacillus sp. HL2]